MAAPSIGGRERWMPPPSARIDNSSPLAVGLLHYFLWNGRTFQCVITGLQLTAQAGLARSTSEFGPGGLSSGAASGAYLSKACPGYPLSFTWVGIRTGSPGNGAGLFCWTADTPTDASDSAPYIVGLDTQGNVAGLQRVSGSSYDSRLDGATIPDGKVSVVVGTIQSGDQNIYQDGLRTATGSTALSTPILSTPFISLQTYRSDRSTASLCHAAMIHTRILSAAEAALLRAKPFAPLLF